MEFWPLYLAAGAVAGGLAGLLGVGGGLVIVPALVFIFESARFPPQHIQHLAVATSLATILFTSLASARAHHLRGAVNWRIVARLAPGILFGTFAGAWFASALAGAALSWCFVIFIYFVALQLSFGFGVAPARRTPGDFAMLVAGAAIGAVSSLVGIGGGSLSVPFLTWCNVNLREAIGTSAALGFPIAAAGSAGFVASGLYSAGLPGYSAGFVYLPALIFVAGASVLTAPIGAALAHRLPTAKLRKIFALSLFLIGSRMLWSLA